MSKKFLTSSEYEDLHLWSQTSTYDIVIKVLNKSLELESPEEANEIQDTDLKWLKIKK